MGLLGAFAAMILRCVLLTAGSSLVGVLCSQFGAWVVGILTSVGFGLVALSVPAGVLDDRKTPCVVIAFGALLVVSTAGLLSLGMVEHRLWPGLVEGIGVEQAGDHPWASAYVFRDARVRADLSGSAPIRGRHGRIGTAFVVPVVPAGWTPDRPVTTWAVATDATLAERKARWQEPVRAGARVVGFRLSEYQQAARSAMDRHRLQSVPEPVFIDWRPEPEQAVRESWLQLLTIVGISATLLIVATTIAWPLSPAGPR